MRIPSTRPKSTDYAHVSSYLIGSLGQWWQDRIDRFLAKRKSRWRCDACVIHARFARDEIVNLAARRFARNKPIGSRSYKHGQEPMLLTGLFFRNCISCLPNCDDLPSNNSSLRSAHIWFSYIHNFIIILSRAFHEPIQRPAPGWLVSLIGRALYRYRRGQGFKSLTSLNFFRLSFRNCISWVYKCDDLPSNNNNFIDNNMLNIKILFTINSLKKLFVQNTIYNSFRLKKNHLILLRKS